MPRSLIPPLTATSICWKPGAFEIKSGSTVAGSDGTGIRAFRGSLKNKSVLVRSAVLHAGQARPLDTGILALPWGWMVAAG